MGRLPGASDLVESSAILRIAGEHAGNPPAVVRGLIDAAIAAGGKDNVTIVLAHYSIPED